MTKVTKIEIWDKYEKWVKEFIEPSGCSIEGDRITGKAMYCLIQTIPPTWSVQNPTFKLEAYKCSKEEVTHALYLSLDHDFGTVSLRVAELVYVSKGRRSFPHILRQAL